MSERAQSVRVLCANYALPALPTYPLKTSNSPTTPPSSTSTRGSRVGMVGTAKFDLKALPSMPAAFEVAS